MRQIPKPYRKGNMVYFVYNNLPHTGVIKEIHKNTYTVTNVTFLHMFDEVEFDVPKQSCIKTGEIWLPTNPTSEEDRRYKAFDPMLFDYATMPKRRLYGASTMSPIIRFTEDMRFLLSDGEWYNYERCGSDSPEESLYSMYVLSSQTKTRIPKWNYQEHFRFNVNLCIDLFPEVEEFVTEFDVETILQKDAEYDNILEEANRTNKKSLFDSLKFHYDIIYRKDHDSIAD